MKHLSISFAKAMAIAPLPVPTSMNRRVRFLLSLNIFRVSPTNSSVSGLGMKTSGVTLRSNDQNSRLPRIYWRQVSICVKIYLDQIDLQGFFQKKLCIHPGAFDTPLPEEAASPM